jgi:hypothetical protein
VAAGRPPDLGHLSERIPDLVRDAVEDVEVFGQPPPRCTARWVAGRCHARGGIDGGISHTRYCRAGPGLPSMERLINLTEHEIALAAQDPPL